MGYDMTMTKVKKVDLEKLKNHFPNVSLELLWSEMLISYYTEEDFEKEYGKETLESYKADCTIFCKELVYANKRIFKGYSLIDNDKNDLTIELSIKETKKLFQWLDIFLRTDFLDNIEEYYGMPYDTVYYEMKQMLSDLQEDEVVIFHHDW